MHTAIVFEVGRAMTSTSDGVLDTGVQLMRPSADPVVHDVMNVGAHFLGGVRRRIMPPLVGDVCGSVLGR